MRILITGICGFIGNHLEKRLSEHEIIGIDDLSSGKKQNTNSKLKVKDVSELTLLDEQIFDKVDIVFHLAAQTSVIDAIKNPLRDLKVNIEGTAKVGAICLKKNIPLIFTSSGGYVYGEGSGMKENDNTQPCSPYGMSKLYAERYLEYFSNLGLNVIIARLSNVYGKGGKGVIETFIKQTKENKPIDIYGDGNQTRDFIYIDDAIDVLIKMMDKKGFGVYNITNENFSVNQLLKIINPTAKVNYLPERGEIKYISLNGEMAKELN